MADIFWNNEGFTDLGTATAVTCATSVFGFEDVATGTWYLNGGIQSEE